MRSRRLKHRRKLLVVILSLNSRALVIDKRSVSGKVSEVGVSDAFPPRGVSPKTEETLNASRSPCPIFLLPDHSALTIGKTVGS